MKIKLLGTPQIYQENSWQNLVFHKLNLLIFYLTYKSTWVSRREIINLFYSDLPTEKSKVNLRNLLKRLRKTVFVNFFEAKDDNLRLVLDSDVKSFQRALKEQNWQKAAETYTGEFLQGYDERTPNIESWLELERRSLQEAYYFAVSEYAKTLEQKQQLPEAINLLYKVLLENILNEELVQTYMRCAHMMGQRQKALEVFESFKKKLKNELDLAPLVETLTLAKQIRQNNNITIPENKKYSFATTSLSSFIFKEDKHKPFHNFVARQQALSWLEDHWFKTATGKGQIVLINGESGTGKSSLINAFCGSIGSINPSAIIARGQCSTYMGVGDPYLAFQDIFSSLLRFIGDNSNAFEKLVKVASNLLRALAPKALEQTLAKLETKERQEHEALIKSSSTPIAHQSQLFTEACAALEQLAKEVPLLITIDDLQWADESTLNLLYYLNQRLRESSVLFVAAYRASEIGQNQHLDKLINESKRLYGEIALDLDSIVEQEQETFVNALLDSEENLFNKEFRKELLEKTAGHPLFTIEFLENFAAEGYLQKNQEGKWIMTTEIDLFSLPAQAEGVIAERLRNIPNELYETLNLASVEGETFTAELIASIKERNLWEVIKTLSVLDKKHHLIKFQEFVEIGGKRLSRYRFRHQLFQHYLYQQLDEVERNLLHSRLGSVLVELVPSGPSELSLQLAQHFQAAKQFDTSLKYWQEAATHAERLAAHSEAIEYLGQVLELLNTLPKEVRVSIGLGVQLKIGNLAREIKGWSAPEVKEAFSEAHTLCQGLDHSPELLFALWGLSLYYHNNAEYETSISLAKQILQISQENGFATDIHMRPYLVLGWNYFFKGQLLEAQKHFEKAITYNGENGPPDTISMCGLAWTLLMLGLEDEAMLHVNKLLGFIDQIEEPYTQSLTRMLIALVYLSNLQPKLAYEQAKIAVEFAERLHSPVVWSAKCSEGWSLYWQGSKEEGLEIMRQGVENWQRYSDSAFTAYFTGLAELYLDSGDANNADHWLKKAWEKATSHKEYYYKPETCRLKAKLFVLRGEKAKAKELIHQGISLAQTQSSKMFESRLKRDLEAL